MTYRAYQGGFCGYSQCRKELGFLEANGGRSREYCNDKCRQAAYRERKYLDRYYKILAYNTELRDYWNEHSIDGALLIALQEILVTHGKEAALAATNAVLLAIQLERRSPGAVLAGR